MQDTIDRDASAVEASEQAMPPVQPPKPKKPKKQRNSKPTKRLVRRIITAVVVIVVIAAAVRFFRLRRDERQASGAVSYTQSSVDAHDLTLTLSGTGTLSPADSYTVTTLISGDVLRADFEEGDIVERDTVLYEINSSDTASSIEQAEIALEQSRRNHELKLESLEDLQIKANSTGALIDLTVAVGDKVTAGQTIAQLRDSSTMCLVIPFGSDDAAGFYVGQSAEITLDSTFERLSGTISKIASFEDRLEGNMLVRQVTIDVANPGAIAVGSAATAMVGDIACNSSGAFEYKAESVVTAAISGDVSAVHVREGDRISDGQLLVTLSSFALDNDIKNSADSMQNNRISLQSRYDQLDDYTIRSPIAGTIIEKNYKAGDTLEGGRTLCTIFDLSYLTMTLNVDELDVLKVAAGQAVTVTAEALPDREFAGIVTKVNINGTTANGVTSYPVTIRIDDAQELLPGMNVQAAITVAERRDSVAIPINALLRGNMVLVQQNADDAPRPTQVEMPEDAIVPEGFVYVEVTPGISDGDYIEITDGLRRGDVIAYIADVVPDADGEFWGGSMGNRPAIAGGSSQ